jgi:hypothetical protein
VDEKELSEQSAIRSLETKKSELVLKERSRQKAHDDHIRLMADLDRQRLELQKSVLKLR